jgi:hypothetical protein
MTKTLTLALLATLTLTACGEAAEYAETYDCTCVVDYEDDINYYEDTYRGSECMEPDEASYVLEDVVEQCVVSYESSGYYNVVCGCECTPTGEEC